MSGRGLNTLLVQRVETALGVTLSQHTQLGTTRGNAGVPPAGRSQSVPAPESATHKQFLPEQLRTQQSVRAQQTPLNHSASSIRGSVGTEPAMDMRAQNAPAASTRMQLSPVGRILYSLFEQFPQGVGPLKGERPLFVDAVMSLRAAALAKVQDPLLEIRRPSTVTATPMPALPSSTALSGALGIALWQSIVQSGLFYESQLWRALRLNPEGIEYLREQPQGQIPAHRSDQSLEELATSIRATIRHQLELLAAPVIHWQGFAWPDVPMNWVILPQAWEDMSAQEQPEQDAAEREAESEPWVSKIALTLPHLGEVNVRLRIVDETVDLAIEAQQAQVLEQAKEQLQMRFEQLNVQVRELTVKAMSKDATDE